jgi:hypothetical protein
MPRMFFWKRLNCAEPRLADRERLSDGGEAAVAGNVSGSSEKAHSPGPTPSRT